jgi:hypothetical protein
MVLGRIPQFPDFKPLEVTDQLAVDTWARQFPPVSDFNFASLWSWNTDGSAEVSWLNGNLVVLFKDYLSPQRFFSFLGTNNVVATTVTLFDAAHRLGIEPDLRLIPEATIAGTPQIVDWAQVCLDPDQSDYVLSTVEWSAIAGSKFRKKRNAIHRLQHECVPRFGAIDLGRSQSQREFHAVFGHWAVQSGVAGRDSTVLQALALQRLFSIERSETFLAFGVYVDGALRAFSINEPLHAGYALGHFAYADRAIPGLYPYLLRESCRALSLMGYRYLNIMQDLGQPGMRRAKTLARPHHHLRKCVLSALTANRPAEQTPRDALIDVSVPLPAPSPVCLKTPRQDILAQPWA